MERRGMDREDYPGYVAVRADVAKASPPPTATIAQVADHIEHVREVAGVDHIGIGSDFDGTPDLPEGLGDVSCFPALFAELLGRGWSEDDCARVAGRNVLRVMREAEAFARATS
jgi:membrane dipeptidase